MPDYLRTRFPLAVTVINLLLLTGTNSVAYAGETDTDGDGLPDTWEESGIDINQDGLIDFFPIGANPMRKDVFLEIDHMEGHFPGLSVINQVFHAFENASSAQFRMTIDGDAAVRDRRLCHAAAVDQPHDL